MNFERILIDVLQRSSTYTSNSLHEVNVALKEINRTLQFIGIQLKELNENLNKNER